MNRLLIKNAAVGGKRTDIYMEDGVIRSVGKSAKPADTVLDAAKLTALPGFVDMHCHLREPGQEYKEDIASGSAAAVAGGFTTICCMPNTRPVVDSAALVEYVAGRGKEAGLARVLPIGAISKGQRGEELAELGLMKERGAVAFSDDGVPVAGAGLMRLCLEYCKGIHALPISHCEDMSLVGGGVVNEGFHATEAGLPGITRAAEEVMVAREILLAESLGARVHIAHVSTRGSVQLVREAKKRGVSVTCETCPHYIAATDELILSYDTNAKVNPPLREESDRQAIIEGLADGTIDAIATDHAPHHADEKNLEFPLAANGISGFETAFALCYTKLVKEGVLTLDRLSCLMSEQPARILGLPEARLAEGCRADVVLVDESAQWTVDPARFFSKGKNTPFAGWRLTGRVAVTIVGGEVKYRYEERQ